MPHGTTATYYFLMNSNTVDDSVGEKLAIKEQRMLAILDDDIQIGGYEFEDISFMSNKGIENKAFKQEILLFSNDYMDDSLADIKTAVKTVVFI